MQHLRVISLSIIFLASSLLCVPSFGATSLSSESLLNAAEDLSSQEVKPTEETVSLQETMARIYMQNTDLDATRAGLRATDETVSQANADWRPSLSVTGQQQYTQSYPIGKGKRAHNNLTGYTAQIDQNIYNGGATEANIGKTESDVLAGRANLFTTEQNTLLKGIKDHTEILKDEAIAKYQKDREAFYKKNWERAEVRFEVGEGSRTDVEAMKGQYEGAKADLSTALGNLESAKAVYLQDVGSPPGKLAPANLILPLPKTYEEALEIAKDHNPAILQARYNLEGALYSLDVQRAGLLPTVGITGKAGNNRTGGTTSGLNPINHPKRTNLEFDATVSIPLYAQGIPNSQVRQAYQVIAQQKVQLVGAQRQTVQQIDTAWNQLIAARDSVKGFLAQVKAQELAVEGAVEEVEVGTKTMLDVQQLEQSLIDSQISLVTAQQNLILTGYQVLVAMGRLTARDMRLKVKYYDPDAYYNEYKNAWIQFWQGKDLRYVKDGED